MKLPDPGVAMQSAWVLVLHSRLVLQAAVPGVVQAGVPQLLMLIWLQEFLYAQKIVFSFVLSIFRWRRTLNTLWFLRYRPKDAASRWT